MKYRLEWTFAFIDEPVVGEVVADTVLGATVHMRDAVCRALGDRYTADHAKALIGIEAALVGHPDPVVEISAKSIVVRLTTVPDTT